MTATIFNVDDNEEKLILSRRRAVVFIFFVGVVVLALLFLIRIDVDIKHGQIGEYANMVEKTTPILEEPVSIAVNGVDNVTNKTEEYHAMRTAVHENQRDPRTLLSSLFGSLYNMGDFGKN